MKRIIVLLGLLSLLLGALPGMVLADTLSEIQDRGVLRVGMEPGYMPFEMTNQKGEIIGFDVDMAKRIAKAMGVKLELVSTAWDGIIPALLTNKFDMIMSGMTVTAERNLKIAFANPYIVVGQSILVKKEYAGEVKSYKDLNSPKFKVGSKLGTTGEQATKRLIAKANYISFETEQEGVMDLVNGKIDAFVYDLPYMAIANAQKSEGKLIFLDQPFTYEPLGWAIRHGNADFLNWLNNFLAQMKNDGTYDKIYEKWFLNDEWVKQLQQ
ncbi:MAG: transporter substrate-binding domain-containing protein [Deltaproteobacteria bacterium]|nr:transporter substrate-binding domain-containing protein [Deltaproteobacteria bacterium]NCP03129.1 transporter substrate-binding domain-containing protein [Deltaproteobacteria bacterium]NCP77979.1 transporter substrate-binding domain-containing protein [Desulfuromonadales bacterium]